MLGRVGGGAIELEELHRFPEHRRVGDDGLERWDIAAIGREIEHGVRVGLNAGGPIYSVSVDSWGVDYVRLIGEGKAVGDPLMYRAAPTKKAFQHVVRHAGRRRRMYEATGVQFLPFNSIFQWIAEGRAFGYRDNLLLMADYFKLAAHRRPAGGGAAGGLARQHDAGVRPAPAGVVGGAAGRVRHPPIPDTAHRSGRHGPRHAAVAGGRARAGTSVRVVATCSHDTAAAVAATPLAGRGGVPVQRHLVAAGRGSRPNRSSPTPPARPISTNEVGYGHSIRLAEEPQRPSSSSRNAARSSTATPITRRWRRPRARPEPLRSLIRPDAAPFGEPGGMTNKIADFCRHSNQPVPETPGQLVRCVYDSLAMLYAETLGQDRADHRPPADADQRGRRRQPGGGLEPGGGGRLRDSRRGRAGRRRRPSATSASRPSPPARSAGCPICATSSAAVSRSKATKPKDDRYPAAAERFASLSKSTTP